MKIKLRLTIGFPTADVEDEIDVVEEWGLDPTHEDFEDCLNDCVYEWAHNYIDYHWEAVD